MLAGRGRPARWTVRRTRPARQLVITLEEVLHDSRHELGVDPGPGEGRRGGAPAGAAGRAPANARRRLTLVRREFPTAIGPVDLLCRDAAARVAVEIKRRGEIDGVEQLTRYLELLNRDPLLAPVRGIFAAQEIKPQARVLAADRGIACARGRLRRAAWHRVERAATLLISSREGADGEVDAVLRVAATAGPGGAGHGAGWRDGGGRFRRPPIGSAPAVLERELLVAVGGDVELALVQQSVVSMAQRDEVGEVGFAAVLPEVDVVGVDVAAVGAAGEPAAVIAALSSRRCLSETSRWLRPRSTWVPSAPRTIARSFASQARVWAPARSMPGVSVRWQRPWWPDRRGSWRRCAARPRCARRGRSARGRWRVPGRPSRPTCRTCAAQWGDATGRARHRRGRRRRQRRCRRIRRLRTWWL